MAAENQYNKTIKTSVVLGTSQVVQMGTTLVRAKMIALLFGPAGAGFNSLILSGLMVMQQVSSLGIFQSGVREMSLLNGRDSTQKLSKFRTIFLRLTALCSIGGMLLMAVLSPLISLILFGSTGNVWWVCLSALTLLFMGFQSGRNTIMQATQNVRLIAKATITGAVCGLVLAAGSFFLLGMSGIVPAIILGYVAFWISFRHFERKIPFEKSDRPSKQEFVAQSTPVLKLGVVLMAGGAVITFFLFLLSAYINHVGSTADVGLYQSAHSMIGQGVIIIQTLLASDFFPRLSAVHTDARQMRRTIKQQTEIILYMITPISVLIIALADQIVWLLLSPEFAPVIKLLQVMSIGMVFRVMWIMMSYILLAGGLKKEYFFLEAVLGSGVNFIMAAAGFYWWGLDGLAYAYLAGALFMTGLLWVVTKKRCKVTVAPADMARTVGLGLVSIATLLLARGLEGVPRFLSLACVCIAVTGFCLFQIDKKSGVFASIRNKLRRKESVDNGDHNI